MHWKKTQSNTLHNSVKISGIIPIPYKFRKTENEDVLSQDYRTILRNITDVYVVNNTLITEGLDGRTMHN